MAVCCEDGSIRLFDVTDDQRPGPQYIKALQKHQARALSACWSGDVLVSGGADGTPVHFISYLFRFNFV